MSTESMFVPINTNQKSMLIASEENDDFSERFKLSAVKILLILKISVSPGLGCWSS